jgi:hypothetical protein
MDVYRSFVYDDNALFMTEWRWRYKEGDDREGRVGSTFKWFQTAQKCPSTEGTYMLDCTCISMMFCIVVQVLEPSDEGGRLRSDRQKSRF